MDFIDFYGTPYNLNILGKRTIKTRISLFSSFITLVVLGITTYLIGKDFFFSTNPTVLTGSVIPDSTDPVYLNNSNFTIALRLEDINEKPISEGEEMAYPYLWYTIFRRTEGNEIERQVLQLHLFKPCLEIEGISTEGLEQFNLSTLLCVDINEIKETLGSETDLPVYGQIEEQFVSMLNIRFSNCKPDPNVEGYFYDCLSFEEVSKRSAKEQYASIFMPRYSFDPEDYSSPFTKYYENTYLKLSPFTEYSESAYYSTVSLSDDKGWIFEDINSVLVFDIDRKDKTPKFLQAESYSTSIPNLYELTLFFQRKQVVLSRSYVKIQELAANLGGIMKVLFTFCSVVNRFYASFKFETAMVAKYASTNTSEVQGQNASQEGVINLKRNLEIGLLDYLKITLGFRSNLKKQSVALNSITDSLDLETLLKIEQKLKAQEESIIKHVRNDVVIRNN